MKTSRLIGMAIVAIVLSTGFCACSDDDNTDSSSNVGPASGTINGHEWVNLGLSVKWATCNVGASTPEEYGDYFAWGETHTKSEYTEENSVTYGKNMGIITSIAGMGTYDAALVNWGGSWRMPTEEEIDELVSKCTHEWTTQGEHNGYKVTGPNGNSIFLPAAGWRDRTLLGSDGWQGSYWGATPSDYGAATLDFHSKQFISAGGHRYIGRTVRPVTE